MRLAEVEAAIDGGAWVDALEGALDVWRAQRHPAFADLVDLLATRVAVQPMTSRGPDHVAFHALWLGRAENPGAAEVP